LERERCPRPRRLVKKPSIQGLYAVSPAWPRIRNVNQTQGAKFQRGEQKAC
jgi:hypothetical protein